MAFGSTPTSTTALTTNQFPVSAVAVPGETSGNLTALEGGPESVDANGNKTAPASMYLKDGSDVAQGTTTDAVYSGSGAGTTIALLKKLVAELTATLNVSVSNLPGTQTVAGSVSVSNFPATQPISAASLPLPSGAALEAGHLATIDTSASAIKTDLDEIALDTDNLSGMKTDLDTLNTVLGTISDTAWTGSGNASAIAILKKIEAVLAGTVAVSGTFWQATQPVSGSVSVSNLPATQAVSGTVGVNNFPATQPVSATSLPLPTGAATVAKQPALGTAGIASSDVLSVQGVVSMTALKTDGSGVTQPVSGTITANAGTGNFTVAQATGSNLHTVVDSGTSAATQSGTWTMQPGNTANTTPWLATINQGGNSATVAALTNSKALAVEVVDASGNQVTSFGGASASVSTTGSAVPASGTYIAGNKAGNLVGLALDGSGNLNVNVAAGGASGGTSSSYGAAFPATGTALGVSDGTNMQSLQLESSTNKNLRTAIYSGALEASVTASNALKVDGSAVTQPTSVASLPLPTGASTAAKQPAPGIAGTASSDVLTVQGITSMTALKTDGSGVTQPISGSVTVAQATGSNLHTVIDAGTAVIGHVIADSGSTTTVTQATASNLNAQVVGTVASAGANAGNPVKTGGVFNTTQPTVTTGQIVDLQSSARGAQIVATGADTFNATINTALPAGTNVIGHVIADSGSTTAVTSLPSLSTGSNLIGNVELVDGAGTNKASISAAGAVKVDGSAVTQPVSGTIIANAGTNLNTSALALDASVNGVIVSQGSATSGQKGTMIQGAVTTSAPTYTTAQTSPVSLTTAGAVRVDASATTQPVSGTVSANAVQSGTWTVQPGNTANTTAWKVDGSAVTQPVSGTVTANAGTNMSTATLALESGGNLATLVTRTPVLGQAVMTASAPVVVASNQSAIPTLDTNSAAMKTDLDTLVSRTPALGAAVTSASTPVNIASDQTLLTKGGFTEQASLSAALLNADLVASVDVSAYKWLSMQVTGAFVGTLSFQCSNDNSNWNSLLIFNSNNGSVFSTSVTSGGLYHAPLFSRYIRVRMTAYTSGTATGTLELYTSDAFGISNVSSLGFSTSAIGTTLNDGINNTAIAAAVTVPTVIKNSGGRLARVLVTTVGTGVMTFYDNASTNSGTVIGIIPASSAVNGIPFVFMAPTSNGITASSTATAPAVTVMWS